MEIYSAISETRKRDDIKIQISIATQRQINVGLRQMTFRLIAHFASFAKYIPFRNMYREYSALARNGNTYLGRLCITV